jgi:ribosomal protein S18 acetylase RimI-like enzyme
LSDLAMPLAIRPAVAADLEAIVALHALGRRETYGHAAGAAADAVAETALLRTRWRQRFAAPPPRGLVLVADRDGAFAGFLTSTPATDSPTVDVVHNLYVVPELRGQGIGRALLRACADLLAAAGGGAVVVNVLATNHRARALYRRLGGTESAGAVAVPWTPQGIDIVHYRWARAQYLALAARH